MPPEENVMAEDAPKPAAGIRRFDVFAEWSRLTGLKKHLDEDDARAYGLAVAKIVAARKFGGYEPGQLRDLKKRAREQNTEREDTGAAWWENLGTAEEFEQKIVRRMGERFYEGVFAPAIRAAWDRGEKYEQIRDRLREQWNERKPYGDAGGRSSPSTTVDEAT